jgi:hypothetical protein
METFNIKRRNNANTVSLKQNQGVQHGGNKTAHQRNDRWFVFARLCFNGLGSKAFDPVRPRVGETV